MLETAQIEEILSHFDLNLENYEIVNLEEKKGWSAKFLYLIVEQKEQFILKGKSADQLSGFMADIEISNFLLNQGFKVRQPVKTKSGNYHYVHSDIHWDLKNYIPGSVEEFAKYTKDSIISLADINIKYIKASLNNSEINTLDLAAKNILDNEDIVNKIKAHKQILHPVIGDEPNLFIDWLHFARDELIKTLAKNTDFSIIHNDLNNKNIVLDLHTMHVTSFIDWDHGCISTPLKDITEPLNMFYDFIPEKYDDFRIIYIEKVKDEYDLKIADSELDLLQVYFYALNKWKYITFFTKLMEELGDSTGEYSEFEEIVRIQHRKLKDLGKLYRVF
jgi:hypothetical protein